MKRVLLLVATLAMAVSATAQHRAMLMAQCEGVDIEHPLALNDIAILRQDTSLQTLRQ